MLPDLDNSDWGEVFNYAIPESPKSPYFCPSVPLTPFSRDDVRRIIVLAEGENDGDSWLGVFELLDGRFAFISAWCDYTGWDCRAGGSSWVASTLDDIIRWAIGIEERKRLNLKLSFESFIVGKRSNEPEID
jgi:hypothetical protein